MVCKRLLALVLGAVLLASVGCGGDGGKGVNKDKDRPTPTEKKEGIRH
jgi:hypothetical protein